MVDAERAMTDLHGKQFHGRPLKVKWSERNARKDAISILENDRKNSVHVKFSSTNVRYISTHFILHYFCG
jgi:RNA recognition motif-containing protein